MSELGEIGSEDVACSDEDLFMSSLNLSSDSVFFPRESPASSPVRARPRLQVSTPRTQRRSKPSKAGNVGRGEKCSICNRLLKTQEGLRKHLESHRLEEAPSRCPPADLIRKHIIHEASAIVQGMIDAPAADTPTGTAFKAFVKEVTLQTVPEPSDTFRQFVHSVSDLCEVMTAKRGTRFILPPAVKGHIRRTVQNALCCKETHLIWRSKLVLCVKNIEEGIPDLFLQEFCRRLIASLTSFILVYMRTGDDTPEEQGKKFSSDDFDTLFDQQTLHNVAGATVKAMLRKARQFRTSRRWQQFSRVLLDRVASVGTSVATPEDASFWTSLLARKSYTFVSERAFPFFVEVAKLLAQAETYKGSVNRKNILRRVFQSPTLLSLWGNVVGSCIEEEDSLYLLKLIVISLCGTVGRGIVYRRMNTEAHRITSVGIRGKLTR